MNVIPCSQNRFPLFDDLLENHAVHAARNSAGSHDTQVVDALTHRDGRRAIVQHVNVWWTVVVAEDDDPISSTPKQRRHDNPSVGFYPANLSRALIDFHVKEAAGKSDGRMTRPVRLPNDQH
jgi:hypothetical protein